MSDTVTIASHFEDAEQQREAGLMGMWLFLATELMLFAGLFGAFGIYRGLHGEAFAEAARHLDLPLASINTAILLTSGLTMALAERSVQAGLIVVARRWIVATVALGAVFLVIKGYEWHHEFAEGLMPLLGLPFDYDGSHPAQAELFFDFYFAMTGLHALHMLVGLGALAVLWVLGRPQPGPRADRYIRQMRITGMYWAFVDVVWVFVFTSLYLLRS
tara:strand:+ start:99 stop:749 length:651 start_codon:yes stop_codon:yes gene_type:complete